MLDNISLNISRQIKSLLLRTPNLMKTYRDLSPKFEKTCQETWKKVYMRNSKLNSCAIAFTLQDVQRIKDGSYPLWKLQRMVLHDTWLRALPYRKLGVTWDLQIIVDDTIPESRVDIRCLRFVKQPEDLVRFLKGLIFPGMPRLASPVSLSTLDRRISEAVILSLQNGLLYQRASYQYIDTSTGRIVSSENLLEESEPFTSYRLNIQTMADIDVSINVDRLELLPGLQALTIDASHPHYSTLISSVGYHPLNKSIKLPFIPISGFSGKVKPIFPMNKPFDEDTIKIPRILSEHSIDSNGRICIQGFANHPDPEKLSVVEAANIILEYLKASSYAGLIELPSTGLIADPRIKPGHIELIRTEHCYVNMAALTKALEKASVDTSQYIAEMPSDDFAITVIDQGPSISHRQLGLSGVNTKLESDILECLSLLCLDRKYGIHPYLSPSFLYSGGDQQRVAKNMMFLLAVFGKKFWSRFIAVEPITVAQKEISDKWTLADWSKLRMKTKRYESNHLEFKPDTKPVRWPSLGTTPEESTYSYDVLRSVLIGTTILQPNVFKDAEALMAAFYYLRDDGKFDLGVNPEDIKSDHFSEHLQPYEAYTLDFMRQTIAEYTRHIAERDLVRAKSKVDDAIVLISIQYASALKCDMLVPMPFQRAQVARKVYEILTKTLCWMSYPFYPHTSQKVYRPLAKGSLLNICQYDLPGGNLVPKSFLDPVKINTGRMMFEIISKIFEIKDEHNISGSEYRAYLTVPDVKLLGFDSKDQANESFTNLIRRICRIKRLNIPTRDLIFNSGRVSSYQIDEGIFLHSFNDTEWQSKEDYAKALESYEESSSAIPIPSWRSSRVRKRPRKDFNESLKLSPVRLKS